MILDPQGRPQRCFALIPARGGSKTVPSKNIRLLAGKPLIAWTIETALASPSLDRVIVSTDDPEIAEISRTYGAEVPFMRPADLAGDTVPDLPVFEHAYKWFRGPENDPPDAVVWLRPTAPLRTVDDIEAALKLLVDSEADSVRSVCPVEHHPYWMQRLDGNRLLPFDDQIEISKYYRRQLLPPAYRLNGAVDAILCRTAPSEGMLFSGDMRGYVMPIERSLDVDTELDFALLEVIFQQREGKRKP